MTRKCSKTTTKRKHKIDDEEKAPAEKKIVGGNADFYFELLPYIIIFDLARMLKDESLMLSLSGLNMRL